MGSPASAAARSPTLSVRPHFPRCLSAPQCPFAAKMLVYKDVITGDEMVTDTFPNRVVDDVILEVDAKFITVKEGDYGLGGDDAEARTVIDVIETSRLQMTSYDKKSFTSYIKGFMKAIKAHLEEKDPDRVEAFVSGAQAAVKKMLGMFKEFEFYTGESMNPEGAMAFVWYKDGPRTRPSGSSRTASSPRRSEPLA